MPGWLNVLSAVALMTGAVFLAWALVAYMIRRRSILAPPDESSDDG
jgi:hypothetical protein